MTSFKYNAENPVTLSRVESSNRALIPMVSKFMAQTLRVTRLGFKGFRVIKPGHKIAELMKRRLRCETIKKQKTLAGW